MPAGREIAMAGSLEVIIDVEVPTSISYGEVWIATVDVDGATMVGETASGGQ